MRSFGASMYAPVGQRSPPVSPVMLVWISTGELSLRGASFSAPRCQRKGMVGKDDQVEEASGIVTSQFANPRLRA